MGRFEQEHKSFQQYEDGDCFRKSVPHGMAEAVAEVLASSVGSRTGSVEILKGVVNDLLSMAGRNPTKNWELGSLRIEIKTACDLLCEKDFPSFMDGLLNAAERIHKTSPDECLRKLNDVLIARNFGYALRYVAANQRLRWEARSEAAAGIAALDEAIKSLTDTCPQALEHLEQAKAQLLAPANSRSRKDAVRDAMSAVEAFAKSLATETDFQRASQKLRGEKVWGEEHIVKEGYATWGQLHQLYPDLRHGQATQTDLPLEEALYWIDRMMTYVKYMSARKRVLGR